MEWNGLVGVGVGVGVGGVVVVVVVVVVPEVTIVILIGSSWCLMVVVGSRLLQWPVVRGQ